MIVIKNESTIFVDCDDTLIMWGKKYNKPHKGAIEIRDPYDDSLNYLKPHMKHINLLKKYKGRGNSIVCWSAGGFKWAEAVIKALKLESYVDLIVTKPIKYIDDLPAKKILGTRLYFKDYK